MFADSMSARAERAHSRYRIDDCRLYPNATLGNGDSRKTISFFPVLAEQQETLVIASPTGGTLKWISIREL